MKIAVFSSDPGCHKFMAPIIRSWEQAGHEVLLSTYWHPFAADVYWFDFIDGNIIDATNNYAESLKGKKVIGRLHSVENYVGHYRNVNWSLVDDLVFVSEHMRRLVGPLPVRTQVIPNPILPGTFREHAPGFKLGYAGNVVPAKGILAMLPFFKELRRHGDYTLSLVGDVKLPPRETEFWQHYIAQFNLPVTLEPYVDNIDTWFQGIDYLWQPSYAESFSLIVGEALVRGVKPLINCFYGAAEVWSPELVYSDFTEFCTLIHGAYTSEQYRSFVEPYALDKVMALVNELL